MAAKIKTSNLRGEALTEALIKNWVDKQAGDAAYYPAGKGLYLVVVGQNVWLIKSIDTPDDFQSDGSSCLEYGRNDEGQLVYWPNPDEDKAIPVPGAITVDEHRNWGNALESVLSDDLSTTNNLWPWLLFPVMIVADNNTKSIRNVAYFRDFPVVEPSRFAEFMKEKLKGSTKDNLKETFTASQVEAAIAKLNL